MDEEKIEREEEILEVLSQIKQVSARLLRDLTILAAYEKTKKKLEK